MASFQKVFLRVTGRIGDTAGDLDKLPDRVMATGVIFIKPNVKDGWAEQTTAEDGIDELMVPAPIQCTIEDGMMTYNGDPFVWLVVGEENWNWNISFPQVRIAGIVRKIDPFNFDIEPATEEQLDDEDYEGVNLALLQEFTDPDTGNKAVRGPRGYSIDGLTLVGGDKLRPSLDDPSNTSLADITIPAIAGANASAVAAAASAAAALISETAAAVSQTAAAASQSSATSSASAAAASQTAAGASQTAAAGSASAASASQTAAGASQTAAAGSASSAGTSASTATTMAGIATAAATAASTSEDNAGDFAGIAGAAATLAVDTVESMPHITVSTTAPSSPATGDIWIDIS